MAQQIQFRRGTAAEWTSANPTLAIGELGLEVDTRKFKIGNGTTAWNAMEYHFLKPTDAPIPGTSLAKQAGFALVFG